MLLLDDSRWRANLFLPNSDSCHAFRRRQGESRLRTKWAGLNTNEVFFRDTALAPYDANEPNLVEALARGTPDAGQIARNIALGTIS
jgi:hypothetical protein